jgi:HAE1 family hydrophobic/amphiphilic exporter-1
VNRLTEFAVAKRSVTLLLAGAMFVLGLVGWSSLKQELLPDIEFPVVTVIAPYPGAGAADVADQVVEPVERAISGIPRLESLQSTSANSIGLVIAQFSFGTDVGETVATIQENLRQADLPDGVEPDASALNINASPVIIASIAATSEEGLDRAAELARTEIVPELLSLEGVARADITGGRTDEVLVTLDPDLLADAGVTTAQVTGVLQANNLTLPAGQLPTNGDKVPVSTIGRFDSVDEIRNLTVGYTQVAPPTDPTQPPVSSRIFFVSLC